mgnify:CR=1 FL=1
MVDCNEVALGQLNCRGGAGLLVGNDLGASNLNGWVRGAVRLGAEAGSEHSDGGVEGDLWASQEPVALSATWEGGVDGLEVGELTVSSDLACLDQVRVTIVVRAVALIAESPA